MSKIAEAIKMLHALNQSEKRYITLGINRMKKHKDVPGNVIELFSQLNNSDIFKQIEKRRHKERIPYNQFVKEWASINLESKLLKTTNVLKLLQIIVDLLLQYNSENGEYRLEKIIQEIRIYKDKGLHEEALKMVVKAKEEIIEKQTNYFKGQEIIFLERQIWREIGSEEYETKIPPLQEENIEQTERAKNFLNAITEQEKLMYFTRQKKYSEYKDFKLSKDSLLVFQNIHKLQEYSFHTQTTILYNLILYYQYILRHQDAQAAAEKAFEYRKQIYLLFENNEDKKKIYAKEYKITLALYLNGFIIKNNLQEASHLIEAVEAILEFVWEDKHLKEIGRIRTDIDFNLLHPVLIYYLQLQEFTKLQEILQLTAPYIKGSKVRKENRYMLYINAVFIYMLTKEYHKSEDYLGQIQQLTGINHRPDYFLVEVLEVINQFIRRNENEQNSSILEASIGRVVVNLSKKETSKETLIARDILQAFYTILNEEKDPFSSKTVRDIERENFYKLQEKLSIEKVEGTLFQYFPILLNRILDDLRG